MLEFLVATAILIAIIASERARRERRRQHREQLMAMVLVGVAPAVARADPRELLAWTRVATLTRQLFPEAVVAIETETGESFPLARDIVERAHARWTAEWLAWERRHDAEFTERTRVLQAELEARGELQSPVGRARLSTLEDEKLQTYQQRYEEYVRVGNGLADLVPRA